MSFWDDFRKFAVRGNALDLTVGVVVGGAFGKIVTSLVNDIVLPPIGLPRLVRISMPLKKNFLKSLGPNMPSLYLPALLPCT